MNNWEKYLNNRLIKKEEGYFVIKPEKEINLVPLSCILCDSLYRTSEDQQMHIKFGCCRACARTWAEGNVDEWNKGYRPSEGEIREVVAKRQLSHVKLSL